MPLIEVKAGMKGKGKSVFEAGRIEEFDAEILGVLENYQPKRNMILARLRGRGLETSGVIEGMSGSPVYVDGKLIGAVAFSFPFSKEPIAGITPIEEMLAIERAPSVPGPGAAVPLPLEKSLTLDDLLALYRKARGPNPAAGAVPESFLPLNVPVLLGGFSTPAFERASAVLFRARIPAGQGRARPGNPGSARSSPGSASRRATPSASSSWAATST